MSKIKNISSYKVLNSRADWTIRCQVVLEDGSIGVETVPDGASKGENEAVYLPVDLADKTIEGAIFSALKGMSAYDQSLVDSTMIKLDGTENKHVLGGNSILAVSLAVARAAAVSKGLPLYKYISSLGGYAFDKTSMPTPVFNIINGGKHAHNNLSFQEFMVIPSKKLLFPDALEMGVNVYHTLKTDLQSEGLDTDVGDEGGFAPSGLTSTKALTRIREAASKVGVVGEDLFFGMDVAAESFWNGTGYFIPEENLTLDRAGLSKYYEKLVSTFELIYLEDPFYEKDIDGWEEFRDSGSKKFMTVGDDLVVTNPKFLKSAIDSKLINAVIVKPNQVGTLTETLAFVKMAQDAGLSICVSHRSGDTAEDTFIADLAVAVGAEFMKSGAPARGERVAKYNRLLEIYHSTT